MMLAVDGCCLVYEFEQRCIEQIPDRFPAELIILHDAVFACALSRAAQVYYELVA